MGKKAIVVFELLVAAIFISLLAYVFNPIVEIAINSNKEIENLNQATVDAELAPYDDTIVSGDTVLNTIKNGKTLGKGIKMKYIVDGVEYGYLATGYKDDVDVSVISPADEYKAELDKNTNGVITSITFTKQ